MAEQMVAVTFKTGAKGAMRKVIAERMAKKKQLTIDKPKPVKVKTSKAVEKKEKED